MEKRKKEKKKVSVHSCWTFVAFPGIAERQLGNMSKVFIYTRSKFAELALRDPR